MPRLFLFCCLVLLASVLSCNKEPVEKISEEVSVDVRSTLPGIKPVAIKNGVLQFATVEDFREAVSKVQEYTDAELARWEKEVGFLSMWRNYYAEYAEFEKLESETEAPAFISGKEKYLKYRDGELPPLFESRSFGYLLDKNGRYRIGNSLYCLTGSHQIIIVDGSQEKLDKALQTMKADEENGIYISNIYGDNQQVESRNPTNCISFSCPGVANVFCEDKDSDNDKRLRSWIDAFTICNVVQSNPTIIRCDFYTKWRMESRKKKGFNWNRTWIDVQYTGTLSSFSGNCSGFGGTIGVNETAFDVADHEITFYFGGGFFGGNCNFLFNFVSNAITDRLEDGTNDLQTEIDCN